MSRAPTDEPGIIAELRRAAAEQPSGSIVRAYLEAAAEQNARLAARLIELEARHADVLNLTAPMVAERDTARVWARRWKAAAKAGREWQQRYAALWASLMPWGSTYAGAQTARAVYESAQARAAEAERRAERAQGVVTAAGEWLDAERYAAQGGEDADLLASEACRALVAAVAALRAEREGGSK